MTRLPTMTGRRAAQLVVWVLAALVVLLCVSSGTSSSTHSSRTTDATTAAASAFPRPASGTYLAAGDTGSVGSSSSSAPPSVFGAIGGISAAQANKLTDGTPDPEHWLPAYRWQHGFELQSEPPHGWFGMQLPTMAGVASALAGLGFAIAGFLWTLLLGLTRWSFTMSVVDACATQINTLSADLWASMSGSGVVAVVMFMVLVSAGLAMLRTRGGGGAVAVRKIALFIVPIAALQVLMAHPTATSGTHDFQMTPVGIAQRGSQTVDNMVLAVALPLTQDPLQASSAGNDATASDGPSCEYYIDRLYGTYRNVASLGNDDKSLAALSLVSRMWEATQLRAFTIGQYGDYQQGRYAACHQLESQTEVSSSEQAWVAGATHEGSNDVVDGSPYKGMQLFDEDGSFIHNGKISVFQSYGAANQQDAWLFAWMACRTPDANSWPSAASEDRLDPDDCETWWSGDHKSNQYSNDSDSLTFGSGDDDNPMVKLHGPDSPEYKIVSTFMTGKGRLVLSFTAILTAVGYLLALGGLAVGTIVATALLALLLAFCPATALLLALPTKGQSRNPIGVRMLRMTGTTLLAKTTFYAFITAVCLIINLLNSMTGA